MYLCLGEIAFENSSSWQVPDCLKGTLLFSLTVLLESGENVMLMINRML